MSNSVVSIRNLHKIYRLYAKPQYRLWDMLGLLRNRKAAYSEHPALNGINLDIERGEKVAIIGRNGAGKSTLLKLITMVIEPTSGSLDVQGKTQALLQIGTGFHPDFTGRENVTAYLAQVGIRGSRMRQLTEEIIDFAEIEGYIDQPLKTYSTGMAMRLMFAASTVLAPEILVIDEVLSVGDAYFAHKSFERIEQLCAGGNTTLLLVSHDIYNAAKLCDRMIWIDRGRVLMDDKSSEVIKAYDSFIHAQEEERLRSKALQALGPETARSGTKRFLLEIRTPDNQPLAAPVYFREIAVHLGGELLGKTPSDGDAFDCNRPLYLQREGTAWGEQSEWQNQAVLPFRNSGTRFHKAVVVCKAPLQSLEDKDITVELDYYCETAEAVDLVVCDATSEYFLSRAELQSGKWTRIAVGSAQRPESVASSKNAAVALSGSGVIWITGVRMKNAAGQDSVIFDHDEKAHIEVDYRLAEQGMSVDFQVVLAFHRDGVTDVCRMLSQPMSTSDCGVGSVHAHLSRMLLGAGAYTLTVMFMKVGYYEAEPTLFYSLNPDVYCVFNRGLEFKVQKGGTLGTGTGVVAQCDWELERKPAVESCH